MSMDDAAPPAGRGDRPNLADREWDPAEWENAWGADSDVDETPPEPSWVADAHRDSIRAAIAAAAEAPVGRDALTLLAELDADELAAHAIQADRATGAEAGIEPGTGTSTGTGTQTTSARCGRDAARGLLDGIVLAQRLVNHVQAVQQKLMAALARPGVAIPLAELVDLAGSDLTDALAAAVDAAAASGAATASRTAPAGGAAAGDATGPAADSIPDPHRPAAGGAERIVGAAAGGGDPRVVLTHPVWAGAIRDAAVRAAAAEIGCALHLAPITARLRCETALGMVDTLPATLAAQLRGDIDGFRARLIAERTATLPAPLRRRVERRILPRAGMCTAAALRRMVDREVIAIDPAAAQRRVEAARATRQVTVRRGEDDTGIFTAIIPAADGETAYGVLDSIATRLTADGSADGRTRDQLRADAFIDLFRSLAATGSAHTIAHACPDTCTGPRPGPDTCTGPRPGPETGAPGPTRRAASGPDRTGTRGAAAGGGRRPVCLNVYLDAATLARLADRPGEIAGYGAVTADTARALAESADTIRAILARPATRPGKPPSAGATSGAGTAAGVGASLDAGTGAGASPDADTDVGDRTCGTILDAGRAVYRPPERTADYVATRDRTCRFPGCRAPARRCDLDHRKPFEAGGETCPHNLDALCRAHHRVKTFTAWHATRDPATDRLTWTSPLGLKHPTEPAHLLTDDPPPY